MFVTDGVDLPDKLVTAHAKGRLVLFVGAGASIDPPSALPSFRNLARDLAREARMDFDDDEDAEIDRFLGSMPTDFDVHGQAHRLISRADSSPNPTHSAIVRLSSSIRPARIVTTNFDDHLAAAAAAGSISLGDKWIGPALPLGDDFSGLVHLHGSILRSPMELVLTDRDFGRAYLNDAWATRFLQKMFEKFTVLFIGYSVDDPIMRYLSLGLPSKTKRYVLTLEPNDDKWGHLGIRPIGYPGSVTDHSALLAALQAWDVRARMGQLDHQSRMRAIVEAGPTMTPVDRDYVKRRLRSVEGARDFTTVAASAAWLRWAEELPKFVAMFRGAQLSRASVFLARWFGEVYVANTELNGAALQTIQRLGQNLSPELVDASSWGVAHLAESDETSARRWKTFLSTSISRYSVPPDLGLLLPYSAGKSLEPLAALRTAARPFLVLNRRWYLDENDDTSPPDAELNWRTYESSLSEHLQLAIDASPAGAPAIGTLLEESLDMAYDLLDGYYGVDRFDRLGFGRSAIEPHEQDAHGGPEHSLVDALRDWSTKALSTNPGLADRWWSRGKSLYRRLALHLIALDQQMSADDKLRWIMERDSLYAFDQKHETYQVLAVALPDATDDVRADVLAAALAGPTFDADVTDRERRQTFSTFRLLSWLAQSAPKWPEAAAAFARVQSANPTFAVDEHPDFGHWSSSGTWGGHLPIDPEDFIRDAQVDFDLAFGDLVDRDYTERHFDEPTWDDALSVVQRVAELSPSLGVQLWHRVNEREDLADRSDSLKRAVVGGWQLTDLGEEFSTVLALVSSLAPLEAAARTISQFLLAQIRKHVEDIDSSELDSMRKLASDVWRRHSGSFSHGPDSHGSSLALNSWPGELATYWATEVDRRWRNNRDDWSGFNSEEIEALDALLDGPPAALDATRPALAVLTYFLFGADDQFVSRRILPLFVDPGSAAQMWGSYLYAPRADGKLLAAGLLDGAIVEWGLLDGLDLGLEHQFLTFVVSALSFDGLNVNDRQRLLDASVLKLDGTRASRFAEATVDFLNVPKVGREAVWDLWLAEHVKSRLSGIPRNPKADELARWADVVPFVGERIPEAIEIFGDREIGLGSRFRARDFPDGVLAAHGVGLVEYFADRIRHSTPEGWQLPRAVQELIQKVRSVLADGVQPMVDAATSKGFGPAPGSG